MAARFAGSRRVRAELFAMSQLTVCLHEVRTLEYGGRSGAGVRTRSLPRAVAGTEMDGRDRGPYETARLVQSGSM